jgi:predicted kinase
MLNIPSIFQNVRKEFDPSQPRDEYGKWIKSLGASVGGAMVRKRPVKVREAINARPGERVTPGGSASSLFNESADPRVETQSGRAEIEDEILFATLSKADHAEFLREMAAVDADIAAGKSTHMVHAGATKDSFSAERTKVHDEILVEFFKGAANAIPPVGVAPTALVLGGRGGSGKSGARSDSRPVSLHLYDPAKTLVIDADHFKERLAERDKVKGWESKAAIYHEESGHLFDMAARRAKAAGYNVVLDATMKSYDPALDRITSFSKAGYSVQGAFVHLPPQLAAQRAVERWRGKGPGQRGRLVPPSAILSGFNNEKNFEQLSTHFEKWSVFNNEVARDKPAIKVAEYDSATGKGVRAKPVTTRLPRISVRKAPLG